MYLDVKAEFTVHDGGVPVQPLTPERRRELTRSALVEAAADVFAKRGFDGAWLEDISEASGFSLAQILNAATVGMSELAGVDVDQAERYDRLIEMFFRMIGESMAETP